MRDYMHLAKWEFYKLMKLPLAKILLGILVVIMIGITASEFIAYREDIAYTESNPQAPDEMNNMMIEREKFLLTQAQSYEEDPYYTPIQKEAIRRRIAIAEYKIEHNLVRGIYKDMWYFFSDNMFKWVSLIVTLFAGIVGAFCLAGEYSQRTLTPMLLLPYKRKKILTAKYMATFMYAALSLGIIIVLGILSGMIVYGFKGAGSSVVLYGASGPYAMATGVYSLLVVCFKIVEIIVMVFIAFMIAALSKSSALATIITALTLGILMPLSLFAASYDDIWQYTPFLSWDFRKFLEFGSVMPSVENFFQNNVAANVGPMLAGIIVVAYCTLFGAITFYVFCKKDMK